MTSYLLGKNKTELKLNIFWGQALNWLAWGLKPKIGVYAPMSEEDCKLVAKIIRNKTRIFDINKEDKEHSTLRFMSIVFLFDKKEYFFDSKNAIKTLTEIADWFDTCGGLVPEDGEIIDDE